MKKIIFAFFFVFISIQSLYASAVKDLVVSEDPWRDSRAYTSLSAAITSFGSSEGELLIAKEESVASLTIPSNITLRFIGDGAINNSGQLTVNTKRIITSDRQIFTGVGDIDFADGSVVRSSWFANLVNAITVTYDDRLTLVITAQDNITANCAIGDDVVLEWESPRNRIVVNSGYTLRNIKSIRAGDFQLFAGPGDFDFADGTKLKLSWFNRLRSVITWVENETVSLLIDKSDTVDYNITIPYNISVYIARGAVLSLSAILTINSSEFVGSFGCFDDSLGGSVTGLSVVSPTLWGYIADDSTDNAAALQSASDCVSGYTKGGKILIPNGTGRIGSQVTFKSNVSLEGLGKYTSILKYTGTDANAMLYFYETEGDEFVLHLQIRNLALIGNGTSHTGNAITLDNPYRVIIQNCYIYNWGGKGIYSTVGSHAQYRNQTIAVLDCYIVYNYGGGIHIYDGDQFFIERCQINQNAYFGVFASGGHNNLYISKSEFAAYYYGVSPGGAGHQPVPIATFNSEAQVTIEQCSFENNGGTSGASAYNIRTNYDAINQVEGTSLTRNLVIRNNDFKPVQAANRDLTHIQLDYVRNVTIQDNFFEHNNTYAGTYYAIEFGTTDEAPFCTLINNRYDSTFTGRFDGLASNQRFTIIEDNQAFQRGLEYITPSDPTPSVGGGSGGSYLYKTNNSNPTTITALDDGTEGQRIAIRFGDNNTTIDFTGTTLYGNEGADWDPDSGDWMDCVRGESNWYCAVHDVNP